MKQHAMYLKKFEKLILLIVFASLIVLPFIFRGNLYYLGGDDMRLYYIYPQKYLENYVFNLGTDNTLAGAVTGYSTVAYYAPMMYFFSILKLLPVNTQSIAFGLNFAFAFLFFYKLSYFYINKKTDKAILARLISSIFYTFSPIFLFSAYKNQLLAMYLVSVVPAFLYFFLNSISKKKVEYLLISALIITIFSGTIANLPWLLGSLLPLTVILIPIFLKNKFRFTLYSILFVVFLLLMNSYWIFHFINSSVSSGAYSSTEFSSDNLRIAKGVSNMFTPMNQIFLTLNNRFSEIKPIYYINSIFFLIIFISSLFLKFKNKLKNNYFNYILLGFLVTWFLINPNIGKWGSELFVWLTINIPFWGMFKNMYDKFAIAFAFYYALAFCLSFYLILNKLSSKLSIILFTLVFVTIGINNFSFFDNKLTINDSNKLISAQFNDDFKDLIKYLNARETYSRVLWLPLNGPTYVNIEDDFTKYYSGLSPLRILTDTNDLSGRFSFISQYDWFAGDKIFETLFDGNTESAAFEIAKYNIDLIIIDKQNLPENISDFMYGGQQEKYISAMNELQRELSAEKIFDIGSRYSLYEVNSKYKKNTNIKKISSSKYVYEYEEKNKSIKFYEPFNDNWKLYKDNNLLEYSGHLILDDWANEWIIEGKESIAPGDEILIIFEPHKYSKHFNYVSIFSFIIVVTSIGYFKFNK